MVDYDTAVAVVQDRNADPVALARIAYENPDFGAVVAANPRAYPGLKRWLAQFGDDAARAELTRQGFTIDTDTAPVTPQEQGDEQQAEAQQQFAQQDTQQPVSGQFTAMDAAASAQNIQVTNPQMNQYAAAPEQTVQPPATNAHGFTVEQALDPATDQMTLAQIAQDAPELRQYLARNPNTYPALLQWLADLNDPAINAGLAARQQ